MWFTPGRSDPLAENTLVRPSISMAMFVHGNPNPSEAHEFVVYSAQFDPPGGAQGLPQLTLLIATGVEVPGINAMFWPFKKKANTSLNCVFTHSSYSSEAN